MKPLRRTLDPFIPTNLNDPVGLAIRLARSKHKAALYAMSLAAAGLLATPLDLILSPAERRLYRRAPMPHRPLVFVIGPPRSGTTLTYQLIINHFDAAYLNNLTALFPRSPIQANLLFRSLLTNRRPNFYSFYGRTMQLSGPNDGLHIWDRWLHRRRQGEREDGLMDEENESLARFWGAFISAFDKPVINKNNSLILDADLVAQALPTSIFICLERNPVFLAQSLYKARLDLQGDPDRSYGLHNPSFRESDPIDDVCGQVRYHQQLTSYQRQRIGEKRFWTVSYEEICRAPNLIVERLADRCVNLGRVIGKPRTTPFEVSARISIDKKLFGRLEANLSVSDSTPDQPIPKPPSKEFQGS